MSNRYVWDVYDTHSEYVTETTQVNSYDFDWISTSGVYYWAAIANTVNLNSEGDAFVATDLNETHWAIFDNEIDASQLFSRLILYRTNSPIEILSFQTYFGIIDTSLECEWVPLIMSTSGVGTNLVTYHCKLVLVEKGFANTVKSNKNNWVAYAQPFNKTSVELVTSQGKQFIERVTSGNPAAYPKDTYSDDKWYKYLGFDNIDPISVENPTEVVRGETCQIVINPQTPTFGGDISYSVKYSYNNNTFSSGYVALATTETTLIASITSAQNVETIRFFAVASDDLGFTSTTNVYGPTATLMDSLSPPTPVDEPKGVYVGVNNTAKEIDKLYVGVNGKAREVEHLCVGVNGKARKIF